MRVVTDVDDVFLPQPRGLLVNLVEARPALETLLERLPEYFADTYATGSALGPALQAMFKMIVSPSTVSWASAESRHVVRNGW
jgi:protein transport protein SEC24